ncbi:Precorrin-2 dehydrogenase [Sulfidibacter corallicola]|uniref:precorrin-2 dehydrogenase n=1 Tax=Sulfidibacter corallicola TaxID=2818388 RepID=A0A8A4TN75_SULCO|nr:bifunctional precorrin-2 dehydrogenase/sirohydrochlorin ferrochelatase [Sulfidibacter corallicola]QTD50378.1 bifunctional precorrin-2 dehydrogenase/sirohydrochlorin ferrochelatase [Sulfidibacter corallicola]
MPLLTVNLHVAGKRCLIVGGGKIARQKAERLMEAGADLSVVAPEVGSMPKGVRIIRGTVEPEDLDGMYLAIFATDDRVLNRKLYHLARGKGVLSMAVDDVDAADFFAPAVLRRGDLEIAVSTCGKGPAFSGHIRDLIGNLIDESYGEALEWFARFRQTRLKGVSMAKRAGLFRHLLALDYIEYFRSGRIAQWEARVEAVLASRSGETD